MGKVKPTKRSHVNGHNNPTGLPNLKELEKEITADDRLGIETVMEKLNSADADDREYGCTALGMYISNPGTLRELLEKNIVRLVTPLLQDSKAAVQWAASIVIRGISEEGGFDACEQMIRQDTITGVAAYLRNQMAAWKTSTQDVKSDKHTHSFVNCIYTIQNLCECSALAVRMAIEDSMPELLVNSLRNDTFSPAVLLAAAQCLFTMSEENETVTDLLKLNASQQVLMALISNDTVSLYSRVVLVGVQLNTFGMSLLTSLGDQAVTVLLLALQVDTYKQMCATIATWVTADGVDTTQQQESEDMDEGGGSVIVKKTENDLRKKLELLDNLISAQKLSLEIFTNILGGDDTDEWADMDDDDNSSCGTAPDATEYMEEDDDNDEVIQNPTAASLAEKGLIRLVRERLQFVESDVYSSVEQCDKTHRQPWLSTIQGYNSMLASALLCLNNITPQVKVDKLGGIDKLHSTMKLLLASLSSSQVSSQEQLVESIVIAIRSIVEQLTKHPQLVIFEDGELQTLQKLSRSTHTATAVNAVRAVAAVGVSISKQSAHPLVKAIGALLLETATTSKDLWLVAESLDSIMDVFADDNNNTYLSELGIISTLTNISPQLKSMVAKRDKTQDQFLPVLATVKTNLPRFIKYKNKVL